MCQALARAARGYGVQWIRYPSARQLGGHCAAVLTPECLSLPEPARLETGLCKVTAAQASMLHDEDRLTVALVGRGGRQPTNQSCFKCRAVAPCTLAKPMA